MCRAPVIGRKNAPNSIALSFSRKRKIDIFRNIAEEAEREMHLGWLQSSARRESLDQDRPETVWLIPADQSRRKSVWSFGETSNAQHPTFNEHGPQSATHLRRATTIRLFLRCFSLSRDRPDALATAVSTGAVAIQRVIHCLRHRLLPEESGLRFSSSMPVRFGKSAFPRIAVRAANVRVSDG